MSGTDEWIEKLIAAGCMPKVAAAVVTEIYVAGVRDAARDQTAEKRREWDREYRRQRKKKTPPPESGGNRVETDAVHQLWTEGVGLLRQLGTGEKAARSNVGLWLKTQKPELVLERIRQANRARAGDPIPWITRSFGVKNGKGSSPVADAFDDLIARAESNESEGDRGPGATVIDLRTPGR